MMRKLIKIQSKASPAITWVELKRKKILEKMMRKLLEMQSKTPPVISMANPNQDLSEFPWLNLRERRSDKRSLTRRVSCIKSLLLGL
ncbi:hypothetical protein MA16_Dca014347 [Dendrobium catenatum]|uniref:Uncharacterized protein n=1 Tax=Dendrobium catenatum TaxID=906689 RepID=A0A2I0WWE4_9ASPA|nr:hypothetical protein MA16_Dca014347 [Dendrobium catenatum]